MNSIAFVLVFLGASFLYIAFQWYWIKNDTAFLGVLNGFFFSFIGAVMGGIIGGYGSYFGGINGAKQAFELQKLRDNYIAVQSMASLLSYTSSIFIGTCRMDPHKDLDGLDKLVYDKEWPKYLAQIDGQEDHKWNIVTWLQQMHKIEERASLNNGKLSLHDARKFITMSSGIEIAKIALLLKKHSDLFSTELPEYPNEKELITMYKELYPDER